MVGEQPAIRELGTEGLRSPAIKVEAECRRSFLDAEPAPRCRTDAGREFGSVARACVLSALFRAPRSGRRRGQAGGDGLRTRRLTTRDIRSPRRSPRSPHDRGSRSRSDDPRGPAVRGALGPLVACARGRFGLRRPLGAGRSTCTPMSGARRHRWRRGSGAGGVQGARRRPTPGHRRCAPRRRRAVCTVTDPSAFDARVHATTLVRGEMSASRASSSSVPSRGSSGTVRTVRPWSAATNSQGATLASWSSSVTMISSPGSRVRASAWTRRKLIVVVLAPKTTSSAVQPRKSAAAKRAS